MKAKTLIPIISAEALRIALEIIDWQEERYIGDRNWDPSTSEHLAEIHVAKQELGAYAQQMSENFGSFYGYTPDPSPNLPMETSQFSLAVKNMIKEIYGEYLPIIEEDADKMQNLNVDQ